MHVLHCTVANDLLYADVMGGGKRVPYPPPCLSRRPLYLYRYPKYGTTRGVLHVTLCATAALLQRHTHLANISFKNFPDYYFSSEDFLSYSILCSHRVTTG